LRFDRAGVFERLNGWYRMNYKKGVNMTGNILPHFVAKWPKKGHFIRIYRDLKPSLVNTIK
jgi:hypothetical protein